MGIPFRDEPRKVGFNKATYGLLGGLTSGRPTFHCVEFNINDKSRVAITGLTGLYGDAALGTASEFGGGRLYVVQTSLNPEAFDELPLANELPEGFYDASDLLYVWDFGKDPRHSVEFTSPIFSDWGKRVLVLLSFGYSNADGGFGTDYIATLSVRGYEESRQGSSPKQKYRAV